MNKIGEQIMKKITEQLKRLIFLCLLMGIAGLSHAQFGIPHIVYGELRYTDDAIPPNITTFEAYIEGHEDDKLSQNSTGCGYEDGQWWIQAANFENNWNAGDVLHISFNDTYSGTATEDVTLTNNAADNAGTTVVRRPDREITIEVTPNTLEFNVEGEGDFTGSHTFTWEQGTTHTISVDDTIPDTDGVRNVLTDWSVTGADGDTLVYTVPAEDETVTAAFETQHRLTIVSAHGGSQGESWHEAGSPVTISVTNPDVVASGERYQLVENGWVGLGEGSYSGGLATFDVTMNEPITETATWEHQYLLSTQTSPSAGGDIVLTPEGGWYAEGTEVAVEADPADNYAFIDWNGDLTGNTILQALTMDQARSVTANFRREIEVEIITDPPNAGLQFQAQFETDDVELSTYTDDHTFLWIEGDEHDLDVELVQPVSDGMRYVFDRWSHGSDASHTYTVPTADATLTAHFTLQYEVDITTAYGSPSGDGWHAAESPVLVSVDSLHAIVPDEERRVFTGWSGDTTLTDPSFNIASIDKPWSVSAAYTTHQYKLTVNSDYGNPEGDDWYNVNSSATYEVDNDTMFTNNETRHLFLNWTGNLSSDQISNTITMDQPYEVTANWRNEYYFTMLKNPVTGGGTLFDHTGWHKADTTIALTMLTTEPGYTWGGWYGDGVNDGETTNPRDLRLIHSKTVTGKFNRHGNITVNTQPADLQWILKRPSSDDTTYTNAASFAWTENEVHTLTVEPNAVQYHDNDPNARRRFVFDHWEDGQNEYDTPEIDYVVPESDVTLTAVFRVEYFVDIVSAHGSPTASSWVEAGTDFEFSVLRSDSVDVGERYLMTGWTGDGPGSYTGPDSLYTLTVDTCMTETASWQLQYRLDLISPYGTLTVTPNSDWHNAGAVVNFGVSQYHPVSADTQYAFVRWDGAGNPAYSGTDHDNHNITMDSHVVETASWEVQYYLHIEKSPDNGGTVETSPLGLGPWFAAGVKVNVIAQEADGYQWHGWAEDLISNARSDTVVMNGTQTIRAKFGEDISITINTQPSDLSFTLQEVGQAKEMHQSSYTFTSVAGKQFNIEMKHNQNGYENGSVVNGKRHPFVAWGDSTTDTNILFTVPDSNVTLTGIFDTQYFLEVKAEEDRPGTPSGGGWYDEGDTATFYMGPKHIAILQDTSRYRFKTWFGTGVNAYNGIDTTQSIVMNGPVTQIGQYVTQYRLHTEVMPDPADGTLHFNPSDPDGWYDHGNTVEVTAAPGTDRALLKWSGTGVASGTDASENPLMVLMDNVKNLTAQFTQEVQVKVKTNPPGLKYWFNGTEYLNEKVFSFASGGNAEVFVETVQEDTIGKNKYIYTAWNFGTANNSTVSITKDTTLIASFTHKCYLEVISPYGEPYGSGWHNQGTNVAFGVKKTSAEGVTGTRSAFTKWDGPGYAGTESASTVLLDESMTQTAVWDTEYLLNTSVDPLLGGTVIRYPDQDWYKANTDVQLTARAFGDGEYYFSGWVGVIQDDQNDTTVTVAMTRPMQITATFAEMSYLITKVSLPDTNAGVIQISPAQSSFVHGSVVTVTANAKTGYVFDHWDGDASGTDPEITVTTNKNLEIKAVFVRFDGEPPEVVNQFPVPESENVLINTKIYFKVIDDIYGLDSKTLNVTIDGRTVVTAGQTIVNEEGKAQTEDFPKGTRFSYEPIAPFAAGRTIHIRIECSDIKGNEMTEGYTFDTGEGVVTEQLASSSVTPSGGQVKDKKSKVTLSIPNGSLTDTTTITINTIENAPELPDSIKGVGLPYHFGPDGISFEPAITVTISYTDADLKNAGISDPSKLRLFYYSTQSGEWDELKNPVVDTAAKTITANVEHFSFFQISAWTASKTLDDFANLYNYPNPFPANANGEVSTTIAYKLQTSGKVSIKIYDATSMLVTTLVDNEEREGEDAGRSEYYHKTWDGTNDKGHPVANNVYFCVLETDSGKRKIHKIALIR